MTIKGKLITLGTLVVIGMVMLTGLMNYSMSTVSELKQAEMLTSVIEADMLTLRRNEKDFLARKDLKYQEKFTKNSQQANKSIMKLKTILAEYDVETTKVDELAVVMNDYKDKFTNIVNIQKEIGLDSKSGLYGSLREAVHQAETQFKELNNDRLLKDMLMLRRNEKDFMLRLDLKYLKKFEKNYQILLNDLDTASTTAENKGQIKSDMALYHSNFKN